MSTATAPVRVVVRRFGETTRKDTWWVQPLLVFLGFTAFIVYSTWAAFQNAHYTFGPYLSPFYSPELFGDSPHAWFGAKPAAWPTWLPFSPALLILPIPGLFRFTCYYYRGAYYKAFWADPPGCTVGEPRKSYWGENSFPLILQNFHRYMLVLAALVLLLLYWDAFEAFWFADPATGVRQFGIGLGTLVLTVNVVLLSCYLFGCHSMRHFIGGCKDQLSSAPLGTKCYDCVSNLNGRHILWEWCSAFSVGFSDLYVRMCSMGIFTDLRIL